MNRRAFLLLAAAVVLLAVVVREWYVLATQVAVPVRGDGIDYMRYAYNLVHHGIFSRAWEPELPVPDAYRGPGYPLFLAAVMAFFRDFNPWVRAVYQAQVVVGALTVLTTIALARRWMPRGAALAAGLLIALWPHHVVATGSVLSETVFGLAILLALLAASLALDRRSMRWGVVAGVALGYAYLINPLIALFPPVVMLVFWRAGLARIGMATLAVSLVIMVGWGMRTVAPSSSRGMINLVQGSLPTYHSDYRWRNVLTVARRDNAANEARVLQADTNPHAALAEIGSRVAADPVRYARWYAIDKPLLLWDRDIQLGWGGVYFLEVQQSPLETSPALHGVKVAYLIANPILTLLMLVFAIVSLRERNPLLALCVLYLTAIHCVFQAEPRYAIAYRPLEAILISGGVVWVFGLIRISAQRYAANPCVVVPEDDPCNTSSVPVSTV